MGRTVDLNHEGLDDIVSDHLEVGVSNPVGDLYGRRRRRGRGGRKERSASALARAQRSHPRFKQTISSLARTLFLQHSREFEIELTVVLDPVKKLSTTVTS